MGLKAQLGWIRNGSQRTAATLASLESELRDLQLKVEALTTVVGRLDTDLGRVDAESIAAIAAMRDQLRTVTDDLGRTGTKSLSVTATANDPAGLNWIGVALPLGRVMT